MKVILFGASGMVGQGVLKECLKDPGVTEVLCIGRGPLGVSDPKLKEIIHKDFTDFSALEPQLKGYEACFFCLGISSAGMSEKDYRHVTYDFTLAAAAPLARLNPQMTFIYVSGAGTDSTEKGRVMWARVKGATENALLNLPFKAAYMFRPGAIQPMDGIVSKTKMYNVLLVLFGWLFPFLRKLFPRHVTTTRILGRAMLKAARDGAPAKRVESWDINALGGS
jgi:uncharacterized protein YbjT (DUF2867 family)